MTAQCPPFAYTLSRLDERAARQTCLARSALAWENPWGTVLGQAWRRFFQNALRAGRVWRAARSGIAGATFDLLARRGLALSQSNSLLRDLRPCATSASAM